MQTNLHPETPAEALRNIVAVADQLNKILEYHSLPLKISANAHFLAGYFGIDIQAQNHEV